MSRAARTTPARTRPSPTTPAATGIVPSARRGGEAVASRARGRAAARWLLPCRLHGARADRRYRLPEQTGDLRSAHEGRGRDDAHDRSRSQACGCPHRHHCSAGHLRLRPHAEPSLIMPGITISCFFNEQGKLIFRAAPLEDQFARAVETVNNPAYGFATQISETNFPGCTRSYLFAR